jgi:hypothetical protein
MAPRSNPNPNSTPPPAQPAPVEEALKKLMEMKAEDTTLKGEMQSTRRQEYVVIGLILLTFLCFLVAVLLPSFY